MTPLPGALGGTELIAWRLETSKHFPTWESAEGAFLVGGRWSSTGHRVLYTSIDPSTAIIEVAAHKQLHILDSVPHTLIEIEIADPSKVYIVKPDDVPDSNWLRPGTVSKGQQQFGDGLLSAHPLVLVPSVVSTRSWNLLINAAGTRGQFKVRSSERFALDSRLNSAMARPRGPA